MMGYLLLILGVLAWSGGHLFKRLAPDARARMGERGKGLVSVLSLGGIVLMVLGYRWAPVDPLWMTGASLVHLNNLLMLLSLYLFAVSGMKTRLHRSIRHPMLLGVILWAIAHLLVNGDLASLILFGGMLVWALMSILLINRDGPRGDLPAPAPIGKEIGAAVGAVIVMIVIGMIHGWLGPWPFGG